MTINLFRLLRQTTTLFAVLLTYLCLSKSLAQQSVKTLAQLAREIDANLEEKNTIPGSEIATSLVEELDEFKQQSVMIFGQRRQQAEERLQQLQRTIDDLRAGSDSREVGAAITNARKIWATIKTLYPKEALEMLPHLWSCPMHPDLMLSAPGDCPTCGMPLEPIYVTQPELTQSPIIRAEITTRAPLETGKKADLRIRLLFNSDGRPVRLDDLEETHTRKIHLLISDLSETDYHHEHPEQVGDGEYAFSFTPARPGTYRVWADLKPVLTHVQQYSVSDIPSTTPREGALAPQEAENRHAEIDGYKFDLTFANSLIHEKETVPGTLRVTGPDGQPFDKLEVVMGAFGHFVGFCDDFATVLHIHPVGALIESPDLRGGPELPFYFRSSKPGLVRFFAQVKVGGKEMFPRFVISVQPLQHLPSF
jgi:Heavy metal binding domain